MEQIPPTRVALYAALVLLRAETSDVAGVPVVALAGRVDLSTLPTLQSVLARAAAERRGTLIALDLDGVDGLDDAALGIILGAAGRIRAAAGDLAVVCTNPALLSRLALTGVDRAVAVVPNLAAVRTARPTG
jgi:anti-anti-sigma factor